MLSWFPTVISSSFRFRKLTSKSLRSSRICINSSSLSGSQGSSTPVSIPDCAQAAIVSLYWSASKSKKWKRISSRPASAKSAAHSGRNGILVYIWRWNSCPNSSFRALIPSKDLSLAINGSPPVIPAPVARMARASSITSSNDPQGLSLAYMKSISRLVSERGQ